MLTVKELTCQQVPVNSPLQFLVDQWEVREKRNIFLGKLIQSDVTCKSQSLKIYHNSVFLRPRSITLLNYVDY